MAAQYLSDPAAQQAVMNTLFTAFAGFTAFGAAIVAVLAGGGAWQKMALRLARRAQQEHPRAGWCRQLDPLVIVSLAVLICLVVLGSGAGLMLSFLWLHAGGAGGWSWAYGVSVDLFEWEVGSMTLITFAAVIAAAVMSVSKVRKTGPSRTVTAPGQSGDKTVGASLPTRLPESPVRPARTRFRNYSESGCTIGQIGPLTESSTSAGWRRRAAIAGAASRSHASERGSRSLAPSSHSLRNTGSSSAETRESS